MPCYDSETDVSWEKINAVTRVACELAAKLEDWAGISPETKEWWAEHQAVDARRLQREKEFEAATAERARQYDAAMEAYNSIPEDKRDLLKKPRLTDF